MIAPFTPVIDQERGEFDSASRADLVDKCAGRWALVRTLRANDQLFPRWDQTEDSIAGDLIHAKLLGLDVELPSARAEKSFRMCEQLRARILAHYTAGQVDAKELENPWQNRTFGRYQLIRELRLWYRVGLTKLFSGQADLVIIDLEEGRALIIDYKSGIKEVPAPARNKQLRALAVLLKHNLPELVSIGCEVLQPWVTWTPRKVEYDRDSLAKAEAEIVPAYSRALYETERTPGEHCAGCEARAGCATGIRWASQANTLARDIESGRLALPSGPKGDETLDQIEAAEKVFKAIKERYKLELTKDPNFLPGRKIAEGNRSLTSVAAAWQICKHRITRGQFDVTSSAHITDLEDLLAHELGWNHKQKRERFNELFADVLIFGEARMLKLSAKEKKERAAAAAALEETQTEKQLT
jgi:Protein of unknown function (DUF2800)